MNLQTVYRLDRWSMSELQARSWGIFASEDHLEHILDLQGAIFFDFGLSTRRSF